MSNRRHVYSREFKREVLQAVKTRKQGTPESQIFREFGVDPVIGARWKKLDLEDVVIPPRTNVFEKVPTSSSRNVGNNDHLKDELYEIAARLLYIAKRL